MDGVVIVGPADPSVIAAECAPDLLPALEGIRGYTATPVENLVVSLLRRRVPVELVTLSPSVSGSVTMSSGLFSVLIGPYRPAGRARDFFRHERQVLRDLLRRTSGPVVHAHWTYEFAMSALQDPRPRAVTIHDAPLTVLRHMGTAYRAARAAMAYRVRAGSFTGVAVSPYLAGQWRRQMLDRRRLAIIPNVVCIPPAPRRPAAAAEFVCVAAAGRLKNVSRLLAAFRLVRARCPDVTLRIVGPGLGPNDPLPVSTSRLELGSSVRWVGPLPHRETVLAMAGATALVHPSLEESFGMTVAEAMTLGVPVVGGESSGAVPWLLDAGRTGVLVDVRRPDALAGGMLRVLDDPVAAELLGAAAAERAGALFTPGAVTDRHLELYAGLQAGHPNARHGPVMTKEPR